MKKQRGCVIRSRAIKVLSEKQKVSLERPYEMDIIGMTGGEQDKLVLVFKLRAGKIVAKDTFWLKRAIDEEEGEVLEFFLKQYYAENHDIPPRYWSVCSPLIMNCFRPGCRKGLVRDLKLGYQVGARKENYWIWSWITPGYYGKRKCRKRTGTVR